MEFSPVDEVKSRLDIVEVIGSYLKLQKSGANFRAICPFHSEKTPSFFVSPARQIWHCFGCGVGGDIFKFIMMIEGIEFGDALRILAQRAGVELAPLKKELKTERERIYKICELATRFFEKQLEGSNIGKEAKDYLFSRGISQESIKKWRIGYAPDLWRGTLEFLISQGYKKEEAEKSGLAIKKENGDFFDRFRGRIIFPIFDINSQVVGFSGRVFKKEEGAKYINTPNTILYDKSRILYGLDKAKLEIRKRNQIILVEGNIDAILAHQAGEENTVATSGTALTPFQLKTLKRYSDNLFICFDMDFAGESATKRGIDLAQIFGFNIKVIRLPLGKDPAEIIYKNLASWKEAIKKAKSILDFYLEIAFSKHQESTLEGKKEIIKIILPAIKRIPNEVEKTFWLQTLSQRLKVREEDLREEMNKISLEKETIEISEKKELPLTKKSRKELLEERLFALLLKHPQYINLINEDFCTCLSSQGREIFNLLKEKQNFQSVSPEVLDYFNFLSLKSEIETIDEKDVQAEINFCIREIRSLYIKQRLDQISLDLKKAEEEKKSEEVEKLAKEFHNLSQNLKEIKN